ncbi:MAG TPA: GAF domain-containing protein, partial [Anaerolineales bacterium]|nr:GAF domain-containing protein [Anaerolineales bacterium]
SELLQTVVNLTQESFALYHAHIYLLDEHEPILRVSAGTGEAGQTLQSEGWYIPLEHPNSIVAQVARAREGFWYNHVQSTPHFLANPLLPDTQAELTVPIIAADQLLGVFDLQSENPERFSEDDILVYTALAQQLAVALQNARRYELAQAEIVERKRAEDALRATEQLFRAAIEAAGAVPYSIQYGAQEYTFMGEGITKLVGYTHEEMRPAKWEDLIHETIMSGTGHGYTRQEAIQKVLTGEITIWQADYHIRTPAGESRWLSDASVQVKNEQGKPFGAIGILQDITERKQVEEALQRLNLELEKRVEERTAQLAVANQELESFTYTVSHDLRAPVRAMVGFTAILLEEYAYQIPLGAQNYLQHIRSGAERLGQLVDGLLTFIRLGRQEFVRREVNLRALAQQVCQEMIENQLG